MNYTEALEYLYTQLPMYQRIGPAAYKDNLDNTLELDQMYQRPHRFYKCIHVAGTNGKGSVSHMLASVLQCAGYKTGLYTSPHLKDFRERIRVNGTMIPEEDVARFTGGFLHKNEKKGLKPSFFELTVAMAFDYFKQKAVDIAVVEVGLGGRLDSTNIIRPVLSVITNISFDHTQLLGDTLEKIAAEKAGIIKERVPVVIGESHTATEPVFRDMAARIQAPVFFADQDFLNRTTDSNTHTISHGCHLLFKDLKTDLSGPYQRANVLTVIAALERLQKAGITLPETALREGLAHVGKNTGLAGRWQKLGENPTIICDTAHNEAGIKWVSEQLEKEKAEQLHIIFGVVNDKELGPILKHLPTKARYYFTRARIERALDEQILKEKASAYGLSGKAYASTEEAWVAAKEQASEKDLIFIGGSTFVVAEVIDYKHEIKRQPNS